MLDSAGQQRFSTLGVWITSFVVIALAVIAYQIVPLGLLPTSAATRMQFSPMALMLVPLFALLLAAAAVAFWILGKYVSSPVARGVWTGVVVAAVPLVVYWLAARPGQGFSLQDLLQPTVLMLLVLPLLVAGVYTCRTRQLSLMRALGVQMLAFGFGMSLYVACVILLGSEA